MDTARVRRSLLRWFARAKRPLPWRRTRDPYAIWVSEMMLQQTTVATVIPYYERFMKRFPTVVTLAAADEDAVLGLWSGLGYYSRARNLRLAARDVVDNHAGVFPRDVETAMRLKGIGRYTASAITSMAWGTRAAVVDGNVRRVLSRLHAERDLTVAGAQDLADALLSPRSPGTWNEAMMELGATVCTPRNPDCARCPVSADCEGRDRPEYWSEGKARRASVRTFVEMALVVDRGRVLLGRVPRGELLGGLDELPHSGLPRKGEPLVDLATRYRDVLEIDAEVVASLRHSVTHHRIEAVVRRARLRKEAPVPGLAFHKLEEIAGLPMGALTRKALRAVELLP